MRTTLAIDDDVLGLARSLADARNGFHVFTPDPQTPQFGPEDVKAALEADDLGWAPSCSQPW